MGRGWGTLRRLAPLALLAGVAPIAAGVPAGAAVPRAITLVGDSVMGTLEYNAEARQIITTAYPTLLDAKTCRRLVLTSCTYKGASTPTALQVLRTNAGRLGDVVVIDVGYNDMPPRYASDLDIVMQELVQQGIPHVLWLTLREDWTYADHYALINGTIRAAAARCPQLRIADWNAYSAGRPWFTDGVHLNRQGGIGLATYVRDQVAALTPPRPPGCDQPSNVGSDAPPLAAVPDGLPAPAAKVTTMNPVRFLDTRPGVPEDGVAGPLGRERIIDVAVAGRGGVPGDAVGALLNVTAVDPCVDGFLTVYPAGGTSVPLASNVNFRTGENAAGAGVIRLGHGGAISVYSSAQTGVIVDVVGYLHPTKGAGLHATDPVRALDTRPAAVPAGTDLRLAIRGRTGVPDRAGVTGAVLNLTVTEPSAAGFVTVYPSPCGADQRPLASHLNFDGGRTVANLVVSALGVDGAVCLSPSVGAKLVVDVSGWLESGGAGFSGSMPTRLVDTRAGGGARSSAIKGALVPFVPLRIPVTELAGMPGHPAAVVLTLTAVDPPTAGYLTAYACGQPPPLASNLNHGAGENRPNVAVGVGPDDGAVCVVSQSAAQLVVDASGWFS